MSRFLPLFLDCRKGPSGFLSDYYYLFIDFRADASRPSWMCATSAAAEPANFFVYYLVDDDTSKHNLTLDGYGADDRWVLLEPTA